MALVDPRLLESLAAPKRPPSLPIKALSSLDAEMKEVVDRRDIDDEAKVKVYNQILRKYVVYEDKANEPMAVQITHSTPTRIGPPSSHGREESNELSADQHILETVPKTMRRKAQLILEKIRKNTDMSWDDKGQLLVQGKTLEGSHITDLVNDVLRKRRRPDPIGWEDFTKGLKSANVPRELVGNKDRWAFMRGEHVLETVPPKRRRKVVSKSRWLSY